MRKSGLRQRSFFSGNICFKFSLLCLCSAGVFIIILWLLTGTDRYQYRKDLLILYTLNYCSAKIIPEGLGGHKDMSSILADQERLVYQPKCGGGGGLGGLSQWLQLGSVSAKEYSWAHGALIDFGRANAIFNLCPKGTFWREDVLTTKLNATIKNMVDTRTYITIIYIFSFLN